MDLGYFRAIIDMRSVSGSPSNWKEFKLLTISLAGTINHPHKAPS
jgi:hypothetical protein